MSKHINLLQHSGIVARRKQGNFSYYRIADETVYDLWRGRLRQPPEPSGRARAHCQPGPLTR